MRNYIKKLSIKQGMEFLDIIRENYMYRAHKDTYDGGLGFERKEHHPGYAGCSIAFNDFYFHVHYSGGYHDYSKKFRLFMMQQENIDAVQYVKDLQVFLEQEKSEKIKEIKEKANKEIVDIKEKAKNDIAYYENMLTLVQNNPDIDFNLK